MSASTAPQPPLPPGWTEHKAPSGHSYYYNAASKQSTYTRPAPALGPPQPQPTPQPASDLAFQQQADFISFGNDSSSFVAPPTTTFEHRQRQPRREPKDWPKSKQKIPGCAPWLLLNTRLRRRFVHNPHTGESFWKFPEHIAKAVVQLDIEQAQRAARRARGEPSPERSAAKESPARDTVELKADGIAFGVIDGGSREQREAIRAENDAQQQAQMDEDDGEYDEIIEEEFDEEEEEEEEEDEGGPPKRQRTEEPDPGEDQQMELGEDDMAWQLEQMGQEYELAPDEYGTEDVNGDFDNQGVEMTAEDIAASFEDMLEDFKVSPYTTWDNVVEDGRIIDDARYTLYPSSKARREAFALWSARRVEEIKAARAKQAKQNPRIPYLTLLDKHATAKLYWPEFKRKFKKEPEMKDMTLSDKEREKLYRDHISRITKMHEQDLEDDLWSLLKKIPPSSQWHNGIAPDGTLPEQLLADIQFISVKPKRRESMLRDFIRRKLPDRDEVDEDQASADRAHEKSERARRDQAMRDRQRQVDDERRKRERDLRDGRYQLQKGEAELRQATR